MSYSKMLPASSSYSGAGFLGDTVYDDLTPLSPTVVPHSSSHNLESLDDGMGVLESVEPFILDMSRQTPSKQEALSPFSPMSAEVRRLFSSKPSFNQPGILSPDLPEFAALKEYCGDDGVYTLHLPREGDRLWHMPQKGWQAIPLLFFELGFRLPMHPLFSALFELLGCGVAQLAPNAVVQICGVIAQSFEKKKVPSLDLLLSIYRVKYAGGQFYLDKKPGRVRLVDVRSSNTGWHGRWGYFAGGELEKVGPWSDISKDWLYELNYLPGLPDEFLDSFLQRKKKFSSEDFTKNDFLVTHCCKRLLLFDVSGLSFHYVTLFLFSGSGGGAVESSVEKASEDVECRYAVDDCQKGSFFYCWEGARVFWRKRL